MWARDHRGLNRGLDPSTRSHHVESSHRRAGLVAGSDTKLLIDVAQMKFHVLGLRNNAAAVSFVVLPCPSIRAIQISCDVSCAR